MKDRTQTLNFGIWESYDGTAATTAKDVEKLVERLEKVAMEVFGKELKLKGRIKAIMQDTYNTAQAVGRLLQEFFTTVDESGMEDVPAALWCALHELASTKSDTHNHIYFPYF